MTPSHPKVISPAEAAALVRPGDWVDYGGNISQPELFDRALAARAGELRDVKVRSCLTLRPHAIAEAVPTFGWAMAACSTRQSRTSRGCDGKHRGSGARRTSLRHPTRCPIC